jgi:hypothetical protein
MIKPSIEQQIREKLPSLDYKITDDFIGIFDGVFPIEYCQNWIKHFDKVDAAGMSYSRVQGMDRPSHVNKDQAVDFKNCSIYLNDELRIECGDFNTGFWSICYPLYAEKYSILQTVDPHKIYTVKIQKTMPGGGYHIWHCEDSARAVRNRLLVFTLYLNDIEDGGETEFLYLSKRIQPKTGRMLIWPAGFTHTHRGNPPLKGDKYIMTGWVEL